MDPKIKTLNELIEKLRLHEIKGAIEILINNKGKINRIIIKNKQQTPQHPPEEIAHKIHQIQMQKPVLTSIDFSRTDLTGSNFGGMNLRGANFSYARIEYSNLAQTNLSDANFYKAILSRSDLSHSYGAHLETAYMTGSVNLYGTNNPQPEVINPLDAPFSHTRTNADSVY